MGIAKDMETGTGTVTGMPRWVGPVAYAAGGGICATWVIISIAGVGVAEVSTWFGLGGELLTAGTVPLALAWQ